MRAGDMRATHSNAQPHWSGMHVSLRFGLHLIILREKLIIIDYSIHKPFIIIYYFKED